MRPLSLCFLLAACGAPEGPSGPVSTLSGEATWRWTFDDGSPPCSYARAFDGVEDRSSPWLCPGCDGVWRAAVTLEGEACAERIGVGPARRELQALDGTDWLRGGLDEPLFLQGQSTVDEAGFVASWASETVSLGDHTGRFTLEAAFEVGSGRGDPLHGLAPPVGYTCGWSRADPPPYDGDYTLVVGEVVPDGLLPDACGEGVRLHDLLGRYLVLDIAAQDCGPCQRLASEEGAARGRLGALGISMETVTLLAPGIASPWSTASVDERAAWAEAFELSGPVVGDRSWGYAVVAEALGDDFAYPSWVVVAPDGTVLAVRGGFSGWGAIEDVITAHHGG